MATLQATRTRGIVGSPKYILQVVPFPSSV